MRSRLILGGLALAAAAAATVVVTTGDDAPPPTTSAAQGPKEAHAPAVAEDEMLAKARGSLDGTELSEEMRAALLASDDPQHARAQRILRAMQGQPEDPTPPQGDPNGKPTPDGSVAIVAPDLPTSDGAVAPVGSGSTHASNSGAPKPSGGSSAPASGASTPSVSLPDRAPKASNTLSGVALKKTSNGATLTLTATSGMMVGVANQRESGIIRFVVKAGATPKVLSSRPGVQGARVSSVKRVGRSVFVTVKLDPGWSLDGIRKTGRGAKIDLRRG